MSSEIIIALDYPDCDSAINTVNRIGDLGRYYKVGLELFIAEGYKVIPILKDMGKNVFLDLKLHDIPNTASKALLSCLKYDVDMVNVHVQGGVEMMKACVEAVKRDNADVLLIGVTLLTSLDNMHLKKYLINDDAHDYVVKLALLSKEAGLDGVVSSAQETRMIKEAIGEDFITVTPGIRLAGGELGDQKRVVTPLDAVKLGTDYMVIGRSITESSDPRGTLEKILTEIGEI